MRRRAILALVCTLAPLMVAGPGTANLNPNVPPGLTCVWRQDKTLACTAPTALVQPSSQGIATAEQVATLQARLGLPGDPQDVDGALRFLDGERFMKVPTLIKAGPLVDPLNPDEGGAETTIEVLDPRALLDLPVLDRAAALTKFEAALTASGLLPSGAEGLSTHTTFELRDNPDASAPSVHETLAALLGRTIPIDTHVSFTATIGDLLVEGPGAEVSVAFDGEGATTSLLYTLRPMNLGPSVPVLDPQVSDIACGAALTASTEDVVDVRVTRNDYVLYAPPIGLATASRLFPHLACGGVGVTAGGEEVLLRDLLVPATSQAPHVTMDASLDGSEIFASATVQGGTAPYSFAWSSAATGATIPDAASISYGLDLRAELSDETLTVIVTDANGLTAVASASVPLDLGGEEEAALIPPVTSGLSLPADPGGGRIDRAPDVGLEWVDARSQNNVNGWNAAVSAAAVPVQFQWGRMSAWEREFKLASGATSSYVDDVDMTVYTGHANGNGWTFESNQADTFLDYRDGVSYGANDLEWLIIAACGPLQGTEGGLAWNERWGRVFNGLHEMFGYGTNSEFNDIELRYFTEYITNRRRPPGFSGALQIEDAWVWAAWESQPSWVIFAAMGPYGPAGQVNYNDYLWGYGSVSSDIPASQISGFYLLSGNA